MADDRIKRLIQQYKTPYSNIFLKKNTQDIFQAVKKDTELYPTRYNDILRLKNSVESIFRDRETRILRGKSRYLSYRKWITFSPCSILLGDLCFIPSIHGKSHGQHIICVFQDAFSKLVFMKIQRSTKSEETLKSFEESLNFFYSNNVGKYRLFCSDQGKLKHEEIGEKRILIMFT